LSERDHVALLCGRYEGVDERIRHLVDEELSIGDYVLSGGEPAAWVVMDAVSRLVPGVLGCGESVQEESFSQESLLEYPQYTRPREFDGMRVPEVLLSGDHQAIARWRRRRSLQRTARRRPELLESVTMTEEERTWLSEQERAEGD
jgi:tRNA (guanine37-N1)-methyltransferase